MGLLIINSVGLESMRYMETNLNKFFEITLAIYNGHYLKARLGGFNK